MREVSQTEAIETLPALLEEAKRHTLIIRDRESGTRLGALISMDDLQIVRNAHVARLRQLSHENYQTIKAYAEAHGENVEEVLDRLLDPDEY